MLALLILFSVTATISNQGLTDLTDLLYLTRRGWLHANNAELSLYRCGPVISLSSLHRFPYQVNVWQNCGAAHAYCQA